MMNTTFGRCAAAAPARRLAQTNTAASRASLDIIPPWLQSRLGGWYAERGRVGPGPRLTVPPAETVLSLRGHSGELDVRYLDRRYVAAACAALAAAFGAGGQEAPPFMERLPAAQLDV